MTPWTHLSTSKRVHPGIGTPQTCTASWRASFNTDEHVLAAIGPPVCAKRLHHTNNITYTMAKATVIAIIIAMMIGTASFPRSLPPMPWDRPRLGAKRSPHSPRDGRSNLWIGGKSGRQRPSCRPATRRSRPAPAREPQAESKG